MKGISTAISYNGKTILDSVRILGSFWEQFMGLRGRKLKQGEAIMYVFDTEIPCTFDMLFVPEKIGYVALNKNKKIIDVGIMKAWLGGWSGKCQFWIECHYTSIQELKIGDTVTFTL